MITLTPSDYATLCARLGEEYVRQRLSIQASFFYSAKVAGHFPRAFVEGARLTPDHTFPHLLAWGLRVVRLYERGIQNALSLTVHHNVIHLSALPSAFRGLRILHISDLHIDGLAGFGHHVAAAVSGLDFDVCVLTGDFRFGDMGTLAYVETELAVLLPKLQCDLGVYGIMGNHDIIELLPILERMGVRMLVNENVALRNNGAAMFLAGVDDPHFYHLHDFDKALATVPAEAVTIVLAHSPEVVEQAAARGSALYLTGHTHGGQICLPNGWPLYANVKCPRRYTVGNWQYQRMQGYTSRGAGASGLFVRYHCPPEITIHQLL